MVVHVWLGSIPFAEGYTSSVLWCLAWGQCSLAGARCLACGQHDRGRCARELSPALDECTMVSCMPTEIVCSEGGGVPHVVQSLHALEYLTFCMFGAQSIHSLCRKIPSLLMNIAC